MVSDSLFELGWLLGEQRESLRRLRWLAEKAVAYQKRGLSEWDTSSIFVEPILRGLGWDTLDNDCVQHENRTKAQLADIQLRLHDKTVALIEVKPLWPKPLDKTKDRLIHLTRNRREHCVAQLWAYGNRFLHDSKYTGQRTLVAGRPVLRGILANGLHWLIYDLAQAYEMARTDISSRLHPDIDIRIDPTDDGALGFLQTLQPSNII